MLGGLALLAMLGGLLAAAGAAFDWEFLFSDGRQPHGWAASMGRAAARTILGLAGGGLMAGGFVARVVAVAETPLLSAAPSDATHPSLGPADELARPPAKAPSAAAVPLAPGRASSDRSDAARLTQRPNPARTRPVVEAPPPAASSVQTITLWNPAAVLEPGGTTLFTVDYRFEAGHRPLPGVGYLWIIDMSDKTRVVEYDGGTLQKQGQLQHVIQTPDDLAGGIGRWNTSIRMGPHETGRQVSNELTVSGDRVQSAPLE